MLFDAVFSSRELDRRVFRNSGEISRERGAKTFFNYPIVGLSHLIAGILAKGLTDRTFRYMVDIEDQLWFSEEGRPSSSVPSHGEMTGVRGQQAVCHAAGNITFSEDFKTIVSLNHISGFFRPSFSSLKLVLAILILQADTLTALGITLPSMIRFEQVGERGETIAFHETSQEELRIWADALPEKSTLLRQPSGIATVTIKAKETTWTPRLYAPEPSLDAPSGLCAPPSFRLKRRLVPILNEPDSGSDLPLIKVSRSATS